MWSASHFSHFLASRRSPSEWTVGLTWVTPLRDEFADFNWLFVFTSTSTTLPFVLGYFEKKYKITLKFLASETLRTKIGKKLEWTKEQHVFLWEAVFRLQPVTSALQRKGTDSLCMYTPGLACPNAHERPAELEVTRA